MDEVRVTGVPCNTKSLLAFVFNQMGKLDRGEITNETAIAQAALVSQANKLLDYELKRSIVQIRLQEIGAMVDKKPALREIESKAFDDTI